MSETADPAELLALAEQAAEEAGMMLAAELGGLLALLDAERSA